MGADQPTTEFSTEMLNDHDLLLGGAADAMEENRANARRWARMIAFFRRREAATRHQDPDDHFALTAREQTALEISCLWGISDNRARQQLNVALFLSTYLPFVWHLCQNGQLDAYRATTIADIARHRLDTAEQWRQLGERLERFLRRHLRSYPELGVEMVTCTLKQLRNKLNYECRVLEPARGEEEFAQAYAERSVRTFEDERGVGTLSVDGRIDDVILARHRIRHAAKRMRADGDVRTMDQLSADIALDVLIGRTEDLPVPAYARPIINLTVPIETVMGTADLPGILNGTTVLPASLARSIASAAGSTWHRLLTDPAGGAVELSTTSYQPTEAIWRRVVAERPRCYRPGCDRPAVECELDHRIPWPEGATSTTNLQPACKRDHKAKHAPGFAVSPTTFRTPAGFKHPIVPDEVPVAAERPELDWEHGMAS